MIFLKKNHLICDFNEIHHCISIVKAVFYVCLFHLSMIF